MGRGADELDIVLYEHPVVKHRHPRRAHRKRVMLGDETYLYDRSQYLAVSVELPVVANVFEANPEEPYFCLTLTVDPRELASLIVETGRQAPPDDHDGRALYLSRLSGASSAEAIAYGVGYASASQFSREYARVFGQPPRRDAERVRDAVAGGARVS